MSSRFELVPLGMHEVQVELEVKIKFEIEVEFEPSVSG